MSKFWSVNPKFFLKFDSVTVTLKTSSSPSSSLFKFGTNFRQHEKNNHEELEQSEHNIRKEIFWTFSRKKNFWKNGNFWWFLAMLRDSQNTAKIGIFVPDVFIFCAFCVYVWCAPTRGSYSHEVGDVPRYPNLEQISRITRCSSPRSRVIFLFEEKKMIKLKKKFFSNTSHKNYILAKNTCRNVIKPKYVINGYEAHLWLTSDDFLKNFR